MGNNINIEELFRSGLENMESQPPAGGWEAIQVKIAASQAAATTATVAAKGGLGLAKIAAIATIAVGTGLGVGYFAFKGYDKKTEKQVPVETRKNQTTSHSNENTVQLPDNVQLTEINSVNKQGKVISIVEVTKGNETQKVLVEVNQSEKDKSPSIVGQWLSTDKNKNKYSQDLINKLLQQIDSDDESVSETPKENNPANSEVKVSKLEENDVIAGIKANVWTGPAPLSIDFSNLTPAENYEWDFGDHTTSKEESPRHVFNEPGNYLVMLTIKSKAGKSYSDKVLITVEQKQAEETIIQEESAITKNTNVFSPNGDNKNDLYLIEGKNIESFQMTIMDQKGNTLFKSNDITQGWDGTDLKGNKLPEGTYIAVYSALGKDKQVYKKQIIVTLNR